MSVELPTPIIAAARAVGRALDGRPPDTGALRAELVHDADEFDALADELDGADDWRAFAPRKHAQLARRLLGVADLLDAGDVLGARDAIERAINEFGEG